MKFPKRVLALGLAMSLSLGCLSGCGTKTPDSSFTPPESIELSSVTDPCLTLTGMSADTVIATVGKSEITAGQFLYWVACSADSFLNYYSMFGITEFPWDTEVEGVTAAQSLKDGSLDTAALYALLPEKAKEEGFALSAEFQTEFDEAMNSLKEAWGGEQELTYYMWSAPLTMDLYRQLCESEDYNSQIMDKYFAEGGERYPDDQAVLDYVENDLQLYSVKHILLSTVDSETRESLGEAVIQEKKALADRLYQQLRDSGNDLQLYDQLMRQYSEDPGLQSSPEGYLAVEPGTMVAPFEEASLALKPGEISQPVESDFGYHIILRLPLEVELEDYREQCVRTAMSEMQKSWLAEAKVKTNENYERLDIKSFYQSLELLRQAVDVVLYPEEQEAADSSQPEDSSAQTGTEAQP